jgi:hypothetical protein
VAFVNATDPFLAREDMDERAGARVEVTWPHDAIGLLEDEAAGPLGRKPADRDLAGTRRRGRMVAVPGPGLTIC